MVFLQRTVPHQWQWNWYIQWPSLFYFLFVPSLWWLRNDLRQTEQNKSKGACSHRWTERTRQGLAPRKEHANSTQCLWAPKVCIMRTLQAEFSADVTRVSHTIFINGPGNPAVETLTLYWEFCLLFSIPKVINGCYAHVMLFNSQWTFILFNPLLDMCRYIQFPDLVLK